MAESLRIDEDATHDDATCDDATGLLDESPYGLIVLDQRLRITTWNRTIAGWTGIDRSQAIGASIDLVFPEFARRRHRIRLDALIEHGTPVVFHGSVSRGLLRLREGTMKLPHYRVTCRRARPGRPDLAIWVENATLLHESVDYLKTEIVARRRVEEELRAVADSRDVLYRELQHRVKNSLSLISSLVALARGELSDPKACDALDDVGARIDSIGLVYEQLAGGATYGEIDLAVYLERLVGTLAFSIAWPAGVQEPDLQLDPCPVPVDTAICIGLIVNELVTNSAKYAFPDGRQGTVGVALRAADDGFELRVHDDGVGIAATRSEDPSGTHLGEGIVELLAQQIEATLERLDRPGTAYRLRVGLESLPTLEAWAVPRQEPGYSSSNT